MRGEKLGYRGGRLVVVPLLRAQGDELSPSRQWAHSSLLRPRGRDRRLVGHKQLRALRHALVDEDRGVEERGSRLHVGIVDNLLSLSGESATGLGSTGGWVIAVELGVLVVDWWAMAYVSDIDGCVPLARHANKRDLSCIGLAHRVLASQSALQPVHIDRQTCGSVHLACEARCLVEPRRDRLRQLVHVQVLHDRFLQVQRGVRLLGTLVVGGSEWVHALGVLLAVTSTKANQVERCLCRYQRRGSLTCLGGLVDLVPQLKVR